MNHFVRECKITGGWFRNFETNKKEKLNRICEIN